MTDPYQALPAKYRPRTWDDLVGQDHPVKVLKASLAKTRIYPCYIFQGAAGSGKTSAARILAMAVNCSERGEDPNPCLRCTACTETLKGRNPDVLEIDGPSYGSVENVRDLKEKTLHSAQFSKRVFVIDEAHGLSDKAFQALLKLLEEPPSHVMFILATTALEKIPATIQSRSIQLDFQRHTEDAVSARVIHVARLEKIMIVQEAADLISRYADGNLRNSVTLLEQLHSAKQLEDYPGPITALDVASAFGIISGTELESLMRTVLDHDAVRLEELLLQTLARTTEFGTITRAITDFYRDVLRTKAGAGIVVRRGESEIELLRDFAHAKTLDQIEQALTVCWTMADRVRASSSNPKSFFLTGLYRLMLLTGATDQPVEIKVKATAKVAEPPAQSAFDVNPTSVEDLEQQLARLAASRTPIND